jgi:hypothetical protein
MIEINSSRASAQPTLRLMSGTNSARRPFWCDVRDTPWSKAMRSLGATAVTGEHIVKRAWRFD